MEKGDADREKRGKFVRNAYEQLVFTLSMHMGAIFYSHVIEYNLSRLAAIN